MTVSDVAVAEPAALPSAPMGSRWETFTTRPKDGRESQYAPVLVWTSLSAAIQYYSTKSPDGGEAAILKALDAQGIRVPLLEIIRNGLKKGVPFAELAQRQLDWNPVHMPKGPKPKAEKVAKAKELSTTPRAVSRRARKAVEQVGGQGMRAFLEKVLAGEVQLDEAGNVLPGAPAVTG